MKLRQILVVVFLIFYTFLPGCNRKNYRFSKGNTYNILVPTSSNALKNVRLVREGDQFTFIKNNKDYASYSIRINPPPPPPCMPIGRCHLALIRLTLIDNKTIILYDKQHEMVVALDAVKVSDDLIKDIRSLQNHSFSAELTETR